MLAAIVPQSAPGILILPLLLALSLTLGWLLAGPLKGTPTHSALERLLIYWLVGVVAFSWVGTILAALGCFRWWLLLPILLIPAARTVWHKGHSIPQEANPSAALRATPPCAQLVLLGMLIGAGWLYARPAESFLVTDDSAVYTIGGIVLARSGSLFFKAEQVYRFPNTDTASTDYWAQNMPTLDNPWSPQEDFQRQFSQLEASGVPSRHYGGFFQWMLGSRDVEIGFLPLPKVWSALAVWLFGPGYAAWATPFLGLTGLAALYGLTRRLLGWQVGLSAVLLLGVSLLQTWFARFPISEIHTQALLLGGLYLLVLARTNVPLPRLWPSLALWSSLALGALTVLRFEGLVLLALLIPLLASSWSQKLWGRGSLARFWLVSLSLSCFMGTLISLGVSRYYMFTRSLIPASPQMTRLLLALLLAALGGGVMGWRYYAQHPNRLAHLRERIAYAGPVCSAGAWLLWGGIALWQLFARDWGSSLAGWLVQYWTRPGLVLSGIGALWLLWREHRQLERSELVAFLGLAALSLLGYSKSTFVTPLHPWAMRRLIPIVLPALAVSAAALLAKGISHISLARLWHPLRATCRWAVPVFAALLLLIQGWAIAQRTVPLVWHQERRGLWQQLESLAGHFQPGSVLLFENGQVGKRLTAVMELVFGYPSFVLQDSGTLRSDSEVVNHLIASALAADRHVFLVITDGGLAWHPSQWSLMSKGASHFYTPVLVYSWGRPPTKADLTWHTFDADIYEVVPEGAESARDVVPTEFDLPLGIGSYPYLRSGFYLLEPGLDAQPCRWTGGEATITLPWPNADTQTPADFCLELDISGGRAPEAEPARLVVEAEGVELSKSPLDKAFEQHTLHLAVRALTNHDSSQLEIRLSCNTWKPADYGSQQDQRILGVMVYGCRLLPFSACPQNK